MVIAEGHVNPEIYTAQQETRLKGKELSEAAGVRGLFVEYDEVAYRFTGVITDVGHRSLKGYAVSFNVDISPTSTLGIPLDLKCKDGMLSKRSLGVGPLTNLVYGRPKSAYFHTLDKEKDLPNSAFVLSEEEERRFYSMYLDYRDRQNELAAQPENSYYLPRFGPVNGLFPAFLPRPKKK